MNEIKQTAWYVYILRCADQTLYTGITNNIDRRLSEHNRGVGAKYTRGRAPVELVFEELADSKGEALRREYAIKKMSSAQKKKIIKYYKHL
ncbi:MAG: GIY-YIG nuclease family protein [Candidatus Thiodiazotropha sp.]